MSKSETQKSPGGTGTEAKEPNPRLLEIRVRKSSSISVSVKLSHLNLFKCFDLYYLLSHMNEALVP